MSKKSSITTYIVIAMILGGVVGYACHTAFPDPKLAKDVAGYISVITDVFLQETFKAATRRRAMTQTRRT